MADVLVLSKYDQMAASPRVRFMQYRPFLEKNGVRLHLSPFFDDAYLRQRFDSGAIGGHHVIRAVGRRLASLLRARRWDLVWFHYELIPYAPAVLESALHWAGIPYVYDIDDAIFHQYDQNPRPIVRRLLGTKVARIMRGARSVIAGNEYLASYARKHNPRVHMIPSVVDTHVYLPAEPRHPPKDPSPIVLGWIGSPSSSTYLDRAFDALIRLAKIRPIKLLAVGSMPLPNLGFEVEVRPWRADREVADLQSFDIGIMPMHTTPWALGKCAFKLIQYMACGCPVVADPVGANRDVVTPDVGFLAEGTDAWIKALTRLIDDPSLRQRMGAAGRARVVKDYSLHGQAPRILAALQAAMESSPRSESNPNSFMNRIVPNRSRRDEQGEY